MNISIVKLGSREFLQANNISNGGDDDFIPIDQIVQMYVYDSRFTAKKMIFFKLANGDKFEYDYDDIFEQFLYDNTTAVTNNT